MRKAFYVILMAATVGSGITPAFAQNNDARREARAQRQQQRVERQQQRAVQQAPVQVQVQTQAHAPAPVRSEARRAERQQQRQVFRQGRAAQQAPAPVTADVEAGQRQQAREWFRQGRSAQQARAGSVREQRQQARGGVGAAQGDRAQRQAEFERDFRSQPMRTFQRAERREDRREDRVERRDDRRDYRQDRRAERRWDRNWRQDNRYDWQRYRYSNRNLYRSGRYYSPYRNHSYSRISIGFSLGSLFYSDRYWLSDPWQYRLPPAYPGTRWVRYYDDVLLVDTYTGEVIDVIYDFFW